MCTFEQYVTRTVSFQPPGRLPPPMPPPGLMHGRMDGPPPQGRDTFNQRGFPPPPPGMGGFPPGPPQNRGPPPDSGGNFGPPPGGQFFGGPPPPPGQFGPPRGPPPMGQGPPFGGFRGGPPDRDEQYEHHGNPRMRMRKYRSFTFLESWILWN